MKRIRIRWLVPAGLLLGIILNQAPAYACSPAPWAFEEAYRAKAMVYGKVTAVHSDRRAAILQVISYAGPGPAPRLVHLPRTEDGRPAPPYSCPDFSMRFKTGEAYLFFLADVPPRLRLLEPQWRTASPVRNGQVMVGLPHGETASLEERLQSFASLRNVAVQTPDSGSPVWGETIWGKLRWLATAAGAALAVLGLGALKRIGRR